MEFVPDAVKDLKSANLWNHRATITVGDFRAEPAAFNLDETGEQKVADKSQNVSEMNTRSTEDVKIHEVWQTLLFTYGKSTAGCYTTRPHA